MTDDSHDSQDSIDDAIGDILVEAAEKPSSNALTLPAPTSSVETPVPVSAATPAPRLTKTPEPLLAKTPEPLKLGTPGPVLTKTPAPLTTRDPSSALPSIPAPTKEPSGAFPLPGMAPEAGKSPDDDTTLIARLSVIDDLVEESTKVEPIDAVLRASSAKEEPIALADQATAERDRALGVSAFERVSAAEFEEPGDDDEMTVSATPGIISISEEDDDEDETTASQRPPSARKTPTPATGGPRLSTPAPLSHLGAPRLPAPTPPPGRTMHLPTPSGGLPSIPMPLVSPASAPHRALTPALPIPAPQGIPPVSAARSAIFNKVQLPLGGLVAFFAAAFGAGVIFGGWMWGRQPAAPTPVAAEVAAPTPTVAKPAPAPEPEPAPVAPPAPAAVAAEPKAAPVVAEPKAAEPKAAELNAAELNAAEPTPVAPEPEAAAVHRAGVIHPKPAVHKPVAAPTAVAAKPAIAPAKPVAAAVAKPVVAAPGKPVAAPVAKPVVAAVAKPVTKPVTASEKPASKTDKSKAKAWVDPFAE